MAEVQLKRKITLRRKEKPAEFTFEGLLKVKLLWQAKTDLDLCIFFTKKDGAIGGVFSSAFRQKNNVTFLQFINKHELLTTFFMMY